LCLHRRVLELGHSGSATGGHIVGVGTYQGKSCGFLLTPAPDYWLKKEFEKVREVLLGLLVIFGGATVGGPGWGSFPAASRSRSIRTRR
jgi:hypothetical protein